MKNIKTKFIFLMILLGLININTNAQVFLGLDKVGRNKRIRFFVGDNITFKAEKSKKFIRGKIENIGDSITISGVNYSLTDFHKIKTTSGSDFQPLLEAGSKILPSAAALF